MRWPQVKDWRILDSIYFCIVTFFTVTAATPANRSRCAIAVYIPPRRSGRLRGHDDADQMRPSAGKLVLRRNMRAEHAGSGDCHGARENQAVAHLATNADFSLSCTGRCQLLHPGSDRPCRRFPWGCGPVRPSRSQVSPAAETGRSLRVMCHDTRAGGACRALSCGSGHKESAGLALALCAH